jgi:hypothetical protein
MSGIRRLLIVAVAVAVCAVGCAADDGSGSGSDDDDDVCEHGDVVVSSLLFEERNCLSSNLADLAGRSVEAKVDDHFRWKVDVFAPFEPPMVVDDQNSSTIGTYVREGLTWVAFTGAIGGVPVGESSADIDAVVDNAATGTVDATFVPDNGNDSLDTVFVAITLGPSR